MPKSEEELDAELEAKFRQGLSGGQETQEAGGDEGELDEDEIPIGEPVEETPESRAQRRAQRPALMDELERLRSENETLSQRLSAIEQRPPPPPAPPPAPPGPDPIAQREAEIEAEQNSIMAAWQSDKLTQEQRAEMRKRLVDLGKETTRLQVRREMGDRPPPQTPEERRGEAIRMSLEAEFPDVYQNPRAQLWSAGRYQSLLAEGQNPVQASKNALAEARVRFKTGGAPPKPSEADRRRHRGEGRGVPSGGDRTTYRLKPGDREIAIAAYSHMKNLTDEQKVRKWVNEVASK